MHKKWWHWPDLKRRPPVLNSGLSRPRPGQARSAAAVFYLSWLPAERPAYSHWQYSDRRVSKKRAIISTELQKRQLHCCRFKIIKPAVRLRLCCQDGDAGRRRAAPVLYTTSPTYSSPVLYKLDWRPVHNQHWNMYLIWWYEFTSTAGNQNVMVVNIHKIFRTKLTNHNFTILSWSWHHCTYCRSQSGL